MSSYWKAFWNGVASVFDITGSAYRDNVLPPPPPPLSDAEALARDRKALEGDSLWRPLERGEVDGNGRWICPHCRDIYGPADAEDGDLPPVCSMCRKAGRT